MKTLVVYYSRTGLTKKIATLISEKLFSEKIHSDLDEVIDAKDRSGPIHYVTAGRDAMKNRLTHITYAKDPKDYDMILIGGPVWAWTITPAIRTYLDKNSDALKVKRVAFFATQGSSGAEKKFEVMQKMLGMKPIATLIVNGKDFRTGNHEMLVGNFVESIAKQA